MLIKANIGPLRTTACGYSDNAECILVTGFSDDRNKHQCVPRSLGGCALQSQPLLTIFGIWIAEVCTGLADPPVVGSVGRALSKSYIWARECVAAVRRCHVACYGKVQFGWLTISHVLGSEHIVRVEARLEETGWPTGIVPARLDKNGGVTGNRYATPRLAMRNGMPGPIYLKAREGIEP